MLSRVIFSFLKSTTGRIDRCARRRWQPFQTRIAPRRNSRRDGGVLVSLPIQISPRHAELHLANVPGEIDFIGCDGTTLAFVEVKYRAGIDPWKPRLEDAVDAAKRRNLFRIAGNFLAFREIDAAAARVKSSALSHKPRSQDTLHERGSADPVQARSANAGEVEQPDYLKKNEPRPGRPPSKLKMPLFG